MKKSLISSGRRARGFTLMETVIAIGVLAVLLTAFLAVFGPAAQGIRKAISVQEADRLAFTLEKELVTLRSTGSSGSSNFDTGFDKAYDWILSSHNSNLAILIYQYRGNPDTIRTDGTIEPFTGEGVAGQDFIVQPVVRRKDDPNLAEDLKALEGRVYTVKLTQLVLNGGTWKKGTAGTITDPTPGDGDSATGTGASAYPEATIAFAADFFALPNTSPQYIQNKLDTTKLVTPMFSRNLAVRR
ncbi:MAG: prepilin-type N-terminal cleavage/methylation domain-containing protein [Akkermansiaceae bacterium]|nr:prepilin-type N-terminal cleavage/methylation domain-containing protein [Akkermansiaceae bacterium]